MAEIEKYKLDAKFTSLKDYCSFAEENDFIEVIEWHNGEGVDVRISNRKREISFSLTHGEFQALTVLCNMPR